MFYKKGVLGNFVKVTGKHLCQSFLFNKVVGLKPATLLKMRIWHSCFPVNFANILRTPFFIEHLWWLLLSKNNKNNKNNKLVLNNLVVRKIFRKTNIFYSLTRTRTCVYKRARNVSFTENFAFILNK